MTCRKLSKSDDRLLQLFLFGSSAVAKLRSITKYVNALRFRSPYRRAKLGGSSPFSSPWNSTKIRRCPCAPPGSSRPFPPTLPPPGGRPPLSGPVGRWDCSSSRGDARLRNKNAQLGITRRGKRCEACRVPHLAELVLSVQPRLKGRLPLGQLFKLWW